MRYLLDTHVWLWLQSDTARVPDSVRTRLADPASTVLLSSVSSWEIAIKFARGKLPLPEPPATYVPTRMYRDAITALPVSHAHALHVATLPHHHSDPFDRLLIAQAQLEGIPLVTADRRIPRYDVEVLPA
ncbi:type II toxin-antitoxin system VapC family toxin [Pseudonocardia sp.]|uniref:type II toxin-antitoxin system VapC family toxin n=1 Tax=Pseudonocardia sp. TaxID=60912 RepID=UPI002612718F|nr:type II toxin-antitoxin system VapC family toxin [Pseudonocardia sp.]